MFRLLGLFLIIIINLSACSRARNKDSHSSLIIQTPTRQQLNKSGLSTFSALPTDRKICYGVSIKGPGIEGFAGSSCAPATGIVGGFVEEGQPLEVFVNRGENRTLELYLFTLPVGSTAACPGMGQNMQGQGLKSTYLIGSKTGISILNDVETIEIAVSFPGLSSSVASQISAPASCTPGSAPDRKGFHVSTAAGTLSGSGFKLKGRVGQPNSGTIATGSGYKLFGRIQ